jgi:hypothetical protein
MDLEKGPDLEVNATLTFNILFIILRQTRDPRTFLSLALASSEMADEAIRIKEKKRPDFFSSRENKAVGETISDRRYFAPVPLPIRGSYLTISTVLSTKTIDPNLKHGLERVLSSDAVIHQRYFNFGLLSGPETIFDPKHHIAKKIIYWEEGKVIWVEKYFMPTETDRGRNWLSDKTKSNVRSEGRLQYLKHFQNGRLHGLCKTWYENGNLLSERSYSNGYKDGDEIVYYSSGQVDYVIRWKHGKRIFYQKM